MPDQRTDTRVIDSLLALTLDYRGADMADAIFGSNYFYYMLKEQVGAFRSQDGGAFYREPIMYGVNSTAKWYSGYDIIDTTPQDPFTDLLYPWCELAASVSISRAEERKNSGRARLLPFLEKLINNAEMTLIEVFAEALMGTGKYNINQTTKEMAGLRSLVPEDPTAYDAGGLDGDKSWWQNKVKGNGGSTFTWIADLGDTPAVATGHKALIRLYNNCKKGPGGPPDIGVSGQYTYEMYEAGLLPHKRLQNDEVARADFDNIKFRKLTWSWDEWCCSASITKSQAATTHTCMYMLNSKFLEVIYDAESLFTHTGFVKPDNQTAKVAQIVFMGMLVVTNRRKQGILVDANVTDIE